MEALRGSVRRSAVLVLGAAALLVATEGVAHADAGQVNKQGRSHTYGDYGNDGLIDRVFGFPEASATAGSTVVVYGNGGSLRRR